MSQPCKMHGLQDCAFGMCNPPGAVEANPYLRPIRITNGPDKGKTVTVDIYDIIASYGVTNIAQAQAAKKILRGGRTDKTWTKDLEDAADSIKRALEIGEAQ